MRKGEINRKTGETDIQLSLNLDGTGKSQIDTGCGFLDHMLTLLASHGRFDLTVKCDGDLQVDAHHTVEDCGIVLGKCFAQALGEMRGINRYGSMILPMDETLMLCAADLSGKTLIDVGCGAGFPGVPVKIACPEVKLTLLDSLGKRMNWLETVLPTLGVEATCITARAEEAVTSCRETYDYATSRAVARLNILLELTASYVKVGGKVLAMKGTAAREELAESQNAIKKVGLKVESVTEFPVDGTAHTVIVLKKVAPTPAKYPRRFAKIKQAPL